MNILILGSGGREHALAWKIKQSKKYIIIKTKGRRLLLSVAAELLVNS